MNTKYSIHTFFTFLRYHKRARQSEAASPMDLRAPNQK